MSKTPAGADRCVCQIVGMHLPAVASLPAMQLAAKLRPKGGWRITRRVIIL